MGQPYVGEIRMFAGNFAPNGWALCQGQTMPIAENETLFQLIGTTYGGDGQQTFNLPDLASRVPVHQGGSYLLGQGGGVESVTLSIAQLPPHNHGFMASAAIATGTNPGNNLIANSQGAQPYIQESPDGNLNPNSIGPAGGNQAHTNIQPVLCINFIISLFGIYPSPT
jgi:microcystin-dependent protein